MIDATKLRTRAATLADAAAIAAIYNEGIADRIATFETEPRSARASPVVLRRRHVVVVAETAETGPVAFAASFPYSAGLATPVFEFSVYVRRDYRGRAPAARCSPRSSRPLPPPGCTSSRAECFRNTASRALLKGLGFAEIGIHRRHGQLDGLWRDCVIVERLLGNGTDEGHE